MNRVARSDYPAHVRCVSELIEGVHQKRCLVTCGRCGGIRSFPRFPDYLTAKYLEQRGYREPLSGKSITCPQCVATEKEAAMRTETEDPQKRKMTRKQAAYLALNKPKPKESAAMPESVTIHVAPQDLVPAVKAEPPRTPTREDNRKISDYLDGVYLVDKGCYKAATADQIAADFLKMPRAWVASVREQFFGPEVNELRKSAPARLATLENRLKAHEDRLLTYAAEVEADRKSVAALRAELTVRP